jgi:cold shock CspA family protein
MSERTTGVVSKFYPAQGYGFITRDGHDWSDTFPCQVELRLR